MIVQSFGAVQALTDPTPTWSGGVSGSIGLYSSTQTYATIYRTQPNVRTVVDFLARNIAQLAVHAFRRLSDTDRERLASHQLVGWLAHPNPATCRYRLIETLMGDLGIYFNAYWLKVRSEPLGLIRLPPQQMEVEGVLLPTAFVWTPDGRERRFAPTEIVYFNGYDPDNPLQGISPLETLRRVLAEESAAGAHREAFWRNAGRMDGVIERPKDAPKWTPEQKQSWRDQWQARFAGAAGAGQVAILEDGMHYQATSWSAKDAEYSTARKLTREECAAAYHVPLPMVGILEHATFSNIKEQHKHLYQDCLGPWMVMITQELERQLLVECDDQRDVYLEFNIAAKLAGSFEEQATSLHTLVGRPIMTANEGRARLNLPSIEDEDANTLAAQQGGPASPPTTEPPDGTGGRKAPDDDDDVAARIAAIVQAAQTRQWARLQKLPAGERPEAFEADAARWNRELEEDLRPVVTDPAAARQMARSTNGVMLTRLQDESFTASLAPEEVLS